ncbi:centrosomal protein of 126 kDa [Spea bombifrons]|uniref:centrosomal protein of 126 kDa n=1 Tax=Spea bombifrons TaxID=233779 RepID=UPI0023497049|nr:centrosomal protein of 126 kDa [Spea bombifrons]
MRNQHTTSYSRLKAPLGTDFEEERRVLLAEQKIHRRRAQKLSVETNRRRKALEEKRREEEEKEQKFREEVLQQRKLKLQEATEKFQRAHLASSQRRREAYDAQRKPTPKLEDALNQIRGTVSSSIYYLPNNRSFDNTRSAGTSSSVLSVNGTWNKKQQPSATSEYERVFQESKNQFDSQQLYFQHKLEEAQRRLEEQHLSSLQNFHQKVEQLAHSESVLSLDSLEDELEKKEDIDILEEFASRTPYTDLSETSGYPVTRSEADTAFIYQETENGRSSVSPHRFLPAQLPTAKHSRDGDQEQSLGHTAKQTVLNGVTEDKGGDSDNTQATSTPNPDAVPLGQSTAENKATHSEPGYKESSTSKPSRAWTTPDPTPREARPSSVPPENKDTIQHPVSQPLAAPPVRLFIEWEPSASNCHHGVSSKKDRNTALSLAGMETVTDTHNGELYESNNGRITCPDGNNQELLLRENSPLRSIISSKDFVPSRQNHSLTSNALTHPDPGYSAQCRRPRNNVCGREESSLLKSILKKCSKYENGYIRGGGVSKVLRFEDTGTAGLRDSIELAKQKENKRTGNKKLRWLDETDKPVGGTDVINNHLTGVQMAFTERIDHPRDVLEHNLLDERSEPSAGTPKSMFSTGYHFTKQAWVTSKGAEASPVDHNQNSQNVPKAKTKLVRRPKSAKSQYAVMHRNRKGAIIRPQSATEASRVLKYQGKLMMPRPPPPRPALDTVNGQPDAKPQTASRVNAYPSNSSGATPPSNQMSPADTASTQSSSNSKGNVMTVRPYSVSETATKPVLTPTDEQSIAPQEPSLASKKRYPIYGENGLRLDHTPTDEEIAFLWQGVRSALTHKNTGDFRPGDLPSDSEPVRNNLSQVLIDGGMLLTNWKPLSRINGVFTPPNSGYITLARRKQMSDSNENKRRGLLEQRRGNINPAGFRTQHIQNLHTLQIRPYPSAHGPGQTLSTPAAGEVSESTVQFMLAENLVETSASDREILTAMQAIQTNKHKSLNPSPSALSLEEQRLLQSLDRLNQRLQNVHEVVKTPSAANGFPLNSPLNTQQTSSQPAENSAATQRFRSFSADPRTRLARRY